MLTPVCFSCPLYNVWVAKAAPCWLHFCKTFFWQTTQHFIHVFPLTAQLLDCDSVQSMPVGTRLCHGYRTNVTSSHIGWLSLCFHFPPVLTLPLPLLPPCPPSPPSSLPSLLPALPPSLLGGRFLPVSTSPGEEGRLIPASSTLPFSLSLALSTPLFPSLCFLSAAHSLLIRHSHTEMVSITYCQVQVQDDIFRLY